MKLEKAIETLNYPPAHTFDCLTPDYIRAVELGIEALDRCLLARKETSFVRPGLLPSETPGEDPLPRLAKAINQHMNKAAP